MCTQNRYSFCDFKQSFACQSQKITKNSQARYLKSEMVTYVERILCRIKILNQKLFLRYKLESHREI